MNINVTFNHNRQSFSFERDANNLDRNYEDEPYALIFEDSPFAKHGYYEINVYKDKDGNLKPDGYVAYYEDIDDIAYTNLLDCEIYFEFEEWEKWAKTHTIADYEKC